MDQQPRVTTTSELQIARVPRASFEEHCVTVAGSARLGLDDLSQRMREAFPGGVSILQADLFGPAGAFAAYDVNRTPIPALRLVGDEPHGPALGGAHIHVASGAALQPIRLDDRVVGMHWETAQSVECLLGGVGPADLSAPAPEQARRTFERMEQALAQAGMDFGHVLRTWLYLQDILAWYPEFNQVRTAFFTERGVFDGLVPASTGIGAANPEGAWMVSGAYAVRSKQGAVAAQAVESPLQCCARKYGSSFSRAVEVAVDGCRRLFVSGTASISPDGKTVHLGDTAAQIERTLDVVAALLESREMSWGHVTRALAYFLSAGEAPLLAPALARRGLADLPVVVANNTICRPDLLFELEVDAARAGS